MRFALFPIRAFARFTHGSSLMTILIKCDEKNIIYDAVNCFLGVFYFMRQGWVEAPCRHPMDNGFRLLSKREIPRSFRVMGTVEF